MTISKQTIVHTLERIAPQHLAEDWDNVGLQVGTLRGKVEAVLLTVDVTLDVLRAAKELGSEFIIAHHPLIFRPVKSVCADLPEGRLLMELIKANLTVYTAHTNWDNAALGTSWQLAGLLQLQDSEILKVAGKVSNYKVVVFVPQSHLEAVTSAMANAGAGVIGNYAHCSFHATGTGTFLPSTAAKPFLGQQGRLETVAEERLEMLVPDKNLSAVLNAIKQTHPYEEPACDVYLLHNGGEQYGAGRLGHLPEAISWPTYREQVLKLFPAARFYGKAPNNVRKVAVCGGSGGSFLSRAASREADVFITGDVSHHHILEAVAHGLVLVDAGHYATEEVILPEWERMINDLAREEGAGLRVIIHKPAPFGLVSS